MKKIKRISPAILRTWLSAVKDAINARNYGEAELLIDCLLERINQYDWIKLREIENAD